MSKRYIFEVEKSHGYGMGKDCFTPTETQPDTGRYLLEFDGPNITLQYLSNPVPGEGGYVIYRSDTGHQKTWLQHHRELTNPGDDVLSIYHINSFAGGELKIYKDGRITLTQYGSGRPLISTTMGHLKTNKNNEDFYDFEAVKKAHEKAKEPRAYNNSFLPYNSVHV